MEYKVVPFVATLNQQQQNTSIAAQQLEDLIKNYVSHGWEYVRVESVSTYVQPDEGCFGIGAKQGFMASYQMVVFSKENHV
ncbi:hypothetical protein ACFO4P_06375 [Epilithonimonas pallida]|uniref:DUF4177 domain-containing protein n=1 Tax=Epilithonimonas pallida TaxID=373671 RepID=A0ABY1R681_9FLAO|nr:hypothetical protein [Epilithonimonas pallida]SMP96533.1 hypothetical protein SAMN05421679_10991 [Epilithonimonas pallida]